MATTSPELHDAMPIVPGPLSMGPYRLADYLELPDEPRVELIEGRYYVSPAPIVLHQVVSMELSAWLLGIAKQAGGQAVAAPCDLVLSDSTVVQPDLAYFGADRRQTLGPRLVAPPDLVIEILSSSPARDRVHKARLYAEHGVAEYWIVDPQGRTFDFLVLRDGKYELQALTSATYTSPRRPELAIDLAAFWPEIDRQTAVD